MSAPLLLCVDDDPAGLQLRQLVLESAGYEVLSAVTVGEALETLAAQPVRVVLLDYLMPEMNGDEAARRMRQIRPGVPIVMLSAYVDLPVEAISAADATLSKIAPLEEMFSLLARLVAKGAPPGAGR